MAVDVLERARRYIAKMDVSVSGENGSRNALACMCALVGGFGLSDDDAYQLFSEWNQGCQPPWNDREIQRLVRNAGRKEGEKGHLLKGNEDYVSRNKGVARAPRSQAESVPKYNPELLQRVIAGVPAVDREWFKSRSPMKVEGVTPGQFIESLYDKGQRVLVMTAFNGQGDFLWQVGKGGFRLGSQEGVKAVRSELPIDGGKDGVWFLNQPVSGKWEQNPVHRTRKTRRSGCNVTEWRYMVLESDEAQEGDWLRLAAKLEMPIVAMYSSGRRSIHALVRVDSATYEDMDVMLRTKVKQVLCPLGADGGALTAVRLTRLPGCLRGGELQELIYLNPQAGNDGYNSILDRASLR